MSDNDKSADVITREEHSAEVASLEHERAEMRGRLQSTLSTMKGEAGELAARRPHPDAHLYDVEEQLRWKAETIQEWLDGRE